MGESDVLRCSSWLGQAMMPRSGEKAIIYRISGDNIMLLGQDTPRKPNIGL